MSMKPTLGHHRKTALKENRFRINYDAIDRHLYFGRAYFITPLFSFPFTYLSNQSTKEVGYMEGYQPLYS